VYSSSEKKIRGGFDMSDRSIPFSGREFNPADRSGRAVLRHELPSLVPTVGTMDSNPTQSMDICWLLFCVCVLCK
jgi:hypothetical protein